MTGEAVAKVFRLDAKGAKCGGCNWESNPQYVLASTKQEALSLLKSGEAGLCGNCFCDMLVETNRIVK